MVVPPLPRESPPAEVSGGEIVITLGDQGGRRYRIRGLEKNLGFDAMKVNVLASRGDAFHVDTLDLYAARNRKLFISEVARELGADENTIKTDLGRVLLKLEELQEAQVNEALKPKDKTPALSDAERAAALALLQSPDLLDRILADFERCGELGIRQCRRLVSSASMPHSPALPACSNLSSTRPRSVLMVFSSAPSSRATSLIDGLRLRAAWRSSVSTSNASPRLASTFTFIASKPRFFSNPQRSGSAALVPQGEVARSRRR